MDDREESPVKKGVVNAGLLLALWACLACSQAEPVQGLGVAVTFDLRVGTSVSSSGTALPPDVRRWLCPADKHPEYSGLCTLVRAPPFMLGKRWHKGIAQEHETPPSAGRSHRRTSGG